MNNIYLIKNIIKKIIYTFSIICILISNSHAENFGLSAKAGTLGLGLELDYKINEDFNFRFRVNRFTYDDDFEEDDIVYSGDIDLSTFGVLVDWRPFKSTFRLTAGLFSNGNELSAIATDNGGEVYEIGDTEYRSASSDPFALNANIKLGKGTAGYLGLGWGNAVSSGWMFSFELGVLFTGKPDVALAASGSAIVSINGIEQQFSVTDSSNPLVQELNMNLRIEEDNIESDLSDFEFYPVISLGIGYRF